MKKPIYNCWWFWVIVIGATALCAGNIMLAHFYKESGTNIFTAVSGWVSGIATIILGIVAVVQNKKYKEENDRYLSAQEELNKRNIKEQQDLTWRNSQYQLFKFYVNTLNNIKNSLNENYFSLIHNDLVVLPTSEETFTKFIFRKNLLRNKLKELRDFLFQSQYFLADKGKLYEKTVNHLEKVTTYFNYILSQRFDNVSQAFKLNNNAALKNEVMLRANASYSTWTQLNKELINHINKLYELMAELNYEDLTKVEEKINNSKSNYLQWKETL